MIRALLEHARQHILRRTTAVTPSTTDTISTCSFLRIWSSWVRRQAAQVGDCCLFQQEGRSPYPFGRRLGDAFPPYISGAKPSLIAILLKRVRHHMGQAWNEDMGPRQPGYLTPRMVPVNRKIGRGWSSGTECGIRSLGKMKFDFLSIYLLRLWLEWKWWLLDRC